jgi:outer membrane protein, heavy metal efflux system
MKRNPFAEWLGFAVVAASLLWSPRTGGAAEASAAAADEISLDALVAEALKANPELNFYQAEIEAAAAGRRIAGQMANPELSAEGGYKRTETRGGNFLGDGAAWSVSVSQAFDFPGRLALRKAIANQQIALARLGLEQFRLALTARVWKCGYRLLVAQENTRAAREVRDRVQDLLAVLVQRDPAGITPLLETRVIEANLVTLQRRASLAEQAVQTARLELNQICGQPLDTATRIAPTEVKFSNLPPIESLLAEARTNNFDLRMRQKELEQQGFRVDLARKDRWSPVTLAPFYSSERAVDQESIVGLGMSIPLPLWDSKKANVDQEKARVQQAEASLRVTERQVERQVTERTLAYQKQLAEMGRWRTNAVAQFREAADLGDRHFRMGSIPVSIYLELQKQSLDATEALLATKAEALENWLQLELLVGGLPTAFAAAGQSGGAK